MAKLFRIYYISEESNRDDLPQHEKIFRYLFRFSDREKTNNIDRRSRFYSICVERQSHQLSEIRVKYQNSCPLIWEWITFFKRSMLVKTEKTDPARVSSQ